MKNGFLQLELNSDKTVLTSKSLFYKTENFIKQTRFVSNIDNLLSLICQSIIQNSNQILTSKVNNLLDCYLVQTSDKNFSFLFKLGCQIDNNLNPLDIVFFDYVSEKDSARSLRIDEYIKQNTNVRIVIKHHKKLVKNQDFSKLYLISNISNINLPKLSKTQQQIVNIVDKNVLVQGVAGSGKTNICIDKIIFTACKNYSGKVLYTTFSRGLLMDTKLKVQNYVKDLEKVLNDYKSNNVVFLDDNHKKALENRLGIYFFSEDDQQIFEKIEKIINYLTNKVDYLLIEDLYKNKFKNEVRFVNQNYFINSYCQNTTNHQIKTCFNKLSKLSKEIIFKEIFGMIFGAYNLEEPTEIMALQNYIIARQNSFSKQECETIYQIAQDFKKHCQKHNLIDNNFASKQLLNLLPDEFEYSLVIVDEVQDYTQANLCLFKKLGLKLFCVGDALQMINPSYFSFGYLKNLLYEKDLTDVVELKHNYRNSAKISQIIDKLNIINKQEFGTHSFVISGQSVDNGLSSTAVYVKDFDFEKQISKNNFDNFTFVVANEDNKKNLQKTIKNQEILTVSEIKGLERSTVVCYNLLSSNLDKWQLLSANKANHKQADENSVYRYYFNLFYVGLSRAKQNVFVVENSQINQFNNFFNANFEVCSTSSALKKLEEIVSKVEFTEQELLDRVNEFIKLEQFENAKFTANKIRNDVQRIDLLRTIEVNENLIQYGKYREAGVKFWEYGLIEDAKKMFTLSGDKILIELIDTISQNNHEDLNIDIVNYYEDVKDNKVAQDFIIETVKNDVSKLKNSFNQIKENFKKGRK